MEEEETLPVCEQTPGIKTNKHGDWVEAAGARQLGSPRGAGGMGADVRKCGSSIQSRTSEPSSQQVNNNQTSEGGPAVALDLRHYSYSWPSGTNKKQKVVGNCF